MVYRTDISEDTLFADPNDVSFVVEILPDSNVGTHWEAKLTRLSDWGMPVVVFDEDEIVNQSDLPTAILGLFDRADD